MRYLVTDTSARGGSPGGWRRTAARFACQPGRQALVCFRVFRKIGVSASWAPRRSPTVR